MKTYVANENTADRKWVEVDAEGKTLGRLAAAIAFKLMGKDKPTYTPHVDTGDFVIVTNADKIVVTGKKSEQKSYDHYTGYISGLRTVSYKSMMEKKPEEIIRLAVRRMLPKTKLGRAMYSKLNVYTTAEHPHSAQQPTTWEPSL